MLLSVDIAEKSFGNKQLFHGLKLSIEAGEKVAIIGRNGVGKSTLFSLLTGQDKAFTGKVIYRQGTRVVSTAQEHHGMGDQTVLDYILANLPDYARLKEIIDTYPDTMGGDMRKIEAYSNALEKFSDLGYYEIDESVFLTLAEYQISEEMARSPLKNLSGGQKRFVELTRIEHSKADVALIDEPTNHMDYIAKEAFIEWFKQVKYTVVVISHDRDLLHWVDRIIEVKDTRAKSFKGNYDAYLKQNASHTAEKMHEYETSLQKLEDLHKQIQAARAKKASTSKVPNPFVLLEKRLTKEYQEISSNLEKPSFWIDRESAENLSQKASESYEKYKDRNIRIHQAGTDEGKRELLHVEDLQLGYGEQPLFQPVNFRLQHGDKLQLIGRNGAGKTTLIRAIVAASQGQKPKTLNAGDISTSSKLRLSVYEQEVSSELLQLTLADAIERMYEQYGLHPTNETVMRAMGNYLFNPHEDGRLQVSDLSGGQKARLQIIKMLANNPNLLVLDEPTNHLDLPSIEELENALMDYHGALLYVSHDSYFAKNVGGEKILITPLPRVRRASTITV